MQLNDNKNPDYWIQMLAIILIRKSQETLRILKNLYHQ